jgi:hypothetical protein
MGFSIIGSRPNPPTIEREKKKWGNRTASPRISDQDVRKGGVRLFRKKDSETGSDQKVGDKMN